VGEAADPFTDDTRARVRRVVTPKLPSRTRCQPNDRSAYPITEGPESKPYDDDPNPDEVWQFEITVDRRLPNP
jgi:hypothetical protein